MKRNKHIVIGSGRLGGSISTLLFKEGKDVIVLDKSLSSFRKLSGVFGGMTMNGDACNSAVLESAHIKEACEVIICTGDDNVNIFLSHMCFYLYDVPNIYVRLSDDSKKKLIENTTIKAIYPFMLSIDNYKNLREEENV